MRYKWIALVVLVLFAGCGPIIGAGMVSGGGVKEWKTVHGQLQDLKPGSSVLVVGPFAKTARAFYICRGEEAANFTTAFNTVGLFQADFYLADRFDESQRWLDRLKQMTAQQLQSELGLEAAPEYLVSGTILHRSTIAAPTKGIMMDVGYRLEFYDLRQHKETSFEVRAKDLFQDCIDDVVSELDSRITGG